MDFLTRIFNRPPDTDSADIAKHRLQLVLAQDRSHISPEILNVLKDEIITVISKHIEIDHANVQVSMMHANGGEQLIANIPIVSTRPPAHGKPERKRAPARRARTARA